MVGVSPIRFLNKLSADISSFMYCPHNIEGKAIAFSEKLPTFASEGEIVYEFAPFYLLKPSQTDHPSIGVAFLSQRASK